MVEETSGRMGVLEYHAAQTNERFQQLGDKFDKILDRMEQLTLNTSTLITTHDSEIRTLQNNLRETATALKETQLNFRDVTEKVSRDVADSVKTLKAELTNEMRAVADRVSALERWRTMLLGAGVAFGIVATKLWAIAMQAWELSSK